MLPNISISKGNQQMLTSQLIEHTRRNIFLEKSCIKCDGYTIPRLFSKNENLAYLWINSLTFYAVCFYCTPSSGLSKDTETKLQTTCFYRLVSSRVGIPLFWGNPLPFWLSPSSWSKFKKLSPSFWEPSKLVHVNCKKHLKMKVLRFVPYKVNWEYQ